MQPGILRLLLFALIARVECMDPKDICRDPVCYFDWDLRWDRTMVYRVGLNAYNVGFNGTDNGLYTIPNSFNEVGPDDPNIGIRVPAEFVNTGDGYPRNIITINGMFPGPDIQVLEGSQVVVRVTNNFFTDDVTIHFHGLRQLNNTVNDGVSHLSQCPITPGQTFTYRFHAFPPGTHWYHAHLKALRLDGLYGMFIVHKVMPNVQTFPMIITDWRHVTSQTLLITGPFFYGYPGTGEFDDFHGMTLDPYHNNEELYDLTILLNGRGRKDSHKFPLSLFTVTPGETYRFRMVHAGSTPRMKIAVDGHKLQVVGTDGTEIYPLEVDFVFIAPGERIDFLLIADQPVSKYWIRAWILQFNERTIDKGRIGIVKYDSSEEPADPVTDMLPCSPANPCRAYNCEKNSLDSLGIRCFDIQSLHNLDDSRTYLYNLDRQEGYQEYFLNFDFASGPTVNGIKFFEPQGHVGQTGLTYVPCDREFCMDNPVCHCTHVLELPYNKSIQLVMSNIGFVTTAHHVIHLHGHEFAVLKQGYAKPGDTLDDLDIECPDSMCHKPGWRGEPPEIEIDRPVIKDTIAISALGYVVIRFRSDNPGMWFLHCHSELHASEGMALVLMTSAPDSVWTPDSLPVCYRNYGQVRVNQAAAISGALDLNNEPRLAADDDDDDDDDYLDDDDEEDVDCVDDDNGDDDYGDDVQKEDEKDDDDNDVGVIEGEYDVDVAVDKNHPWDKEPVETSAVILVPPALLVSLVVIAAIGGALIMLLAQKFFGRKQNNEPRYPPLLSDY